MKTSALFLIFIASIVTASDSHLAWVDEQINAIKPQRSGISNDYINLLKDPVKLEVPKSDPSQPGKATAFAASEKSNRKLNLKPLTLEAIINQSAYINGNWYQLYDEVRNSTLVAIEDNFVVLTDKKKKTRLFVNPKNDKIKITTR